jgi:hypothetical protein
LSRIAQWSVPCAYVILMISCGSALGHLTIKSLSSHDALLRNAATFRIQAIKESLQDDPLWAAREKEMQDRARAYFQARGLRMDETGPDILIILRINLSTSGDQLLPRVSMVVARFNAPIGYASPIWSGYAEGKVAATDAHIADYYDGLLAALLARYPR